MNTKPYLLALVVALTSWFAPMAFAENPTTESALAHEVVQAVTDDMMGIIKNGEKALAKDPDAYFLNIRKTLEPNVAFDFIARGVMANYWKQASADQQARFVDTFTDSMVRTLGKGMANYSDLNIETKKPQDTNPNAMRVTVVQDVKGGDKVNTVTYTMQRKGKEAPWVVTNVTLNGVNLGMSFRDQFVQGVRQNGGDIDKAINNWLKTDLPGA